jgi:hypothetical protein
MVVLRLLFLLLSSRVLASALSLDQPDSGVVPVSKLMGNSVAILAVRDSIANVSRMIATGRVALDIFDVFSHHEPGVSIAPGVRPKRFRTRHGGDFLRYFLS